MRIVSYIHTDSKRKAWIWALTLGDREEQSVVQAVAQCVSHEWQAPAALTRTLHDILHLVRAIVSIGVRHRGYVVQTEGRKRGRGTYELTRSMLFMSSTQLRYGVLQTAVPGATGGTASGSC